MACSAVVPVEVLAHVHAAGADWALLVGSGDCAVLVDLVEFEGQQLDFSVLVLGLLLCAPSLPLLLLLLTSFCVHVHVVSALAV